MPPHLQAQLKQSRPFRSVQEEVFLNVLRTATALQGQFAELLRGYDLTQPQYNVLRILRGAGEGGLPSGEIGERMVSRDPDVTRLLDRLEQRGLARRAREGADRRVVTARITSEGRRLLDALEGPVAALHARQLGPLGERGLETLRRLLRRAAEVGPV